VPETRCKGLQIAIVAESASEDICKGAVMRLSALMGCGLLLAATPSLAAEAPVGEWLVENGHGHVRIENCGGSLWGVVSWEERPGGRDNENPDPALRGRPTLGMPILIDMKPVTVSNWGKTEERWKGQVYSPENGKMYSSSIWLTGPDKMRLEGCVLGGIFCGGQDWTRVPGTPRGTAASAPSPAPKTKGVKAQPKGKANAKAATTGEAAPLDVCSRVSDLAGRTH
jgi:uncharacterized protein (DUF2147 family)